LKVKEFRDAEFRVLDAREGKGKMTGGVIWICENDVTKDTFECTMKVTMAERQRMFRNKEDYIDKLLTVRFFDRTDDKLPRFPVGIVFRDAKDLP
jgi:DNA ligase-1